MENIRQMSDSWWVVTLRGLTLIIIGTAFLAWPGKSFLIVTILVGLLVLLDGVIASISGLVSIRKDKHWWITLLQGILGVVIGLAILNWPGITLGILFFFVAIWIIFNGVLFMVLALAGRKEHYGNWTLTALGIIGILFGIVLLANPEASIVVISILVGVYAIVSGIMNVALGLDLKKVHSDIKRLA